MKEELNFTDITNSLMEIAISDTKISEEEEKVLQNIKENVEKYETSVSQAKEDEVISEDEFHELVILRDNIINAALDFHSDSEKVNSIIQNLFEEINNHSIPGMFEDESPEEIDS